MTAGEAQELWDNGFLPRRNRRGSPDTRLLIGRSDGGRRITLVSRHLGEGIWFTYTAMGHQGGRLGLMTMHDEDRSDLTPEERAVAGAPGDLLSEEPVPARPRSNTVMLSLRIDRPTFDDLSQLAERHGRTFSETARQALRTYAREHRRETSYPLPDPGRSGAVKKVSESLQLTWNDNDLRSALERYELASRQAGMREKAWRSYVDYARRFISWRTGDYRPRGSLAGERPVPRSAASTSELRRQAEQYAREVEAAGREQPTVDTYFRHAMFFVRWLEGDFQPGARLQGLR